MFKYRPPEFYIIVTLTLILVLCGLLIACSAEASRGCLDRQQATRTWPTKQIGVDADGCFTFIRKGVAPAAPDVPKTIVVDGASSASVEAVVALDLLERWPVVMEVDNRRPAFLRPQPLVDAHNLVAAIFGVILFCAVFEVMFGGRMGRTAPNRSQTGPD